MASYDAYDSRPRASRRDDAFDRSRDQSYLRPTPAARTSVEGVGRVGERFDPGQNNYAYSGQDHRQPHAYDPRPLYPPPLSRDTGPPPRQPRSVSRRRGNWPPPPTCENEATSLAKEAGSQHLLKNVGKDEAVLRGTIDQEPIVQNAPEPTLGPQQNTPVRKDSSRPTKNNSIPTPPSSDDEKARKASRKPSKLQMNFDNLRNEVPEMGQRVASPYSYSTDNRTTKSQTPKERFLSPDTLLSPPPTDPRSRNGARFGTRSQPSSPNRDTPRRSPSAKSGEDYFSLTSGESAIDDTDYDTSDSVSKTSRGKSSTNPSTQPEKPKGTPATSVVDFAPSPSAHPPGRLNLDARRNTDTGGTMPNLRGNRNRRTSPLIMSSALGDLAASAMHLSPSTPQSATEVPSSRSRDSSYNLSRGVSPAGSAASYRSHGTATPPETPRTSSEFPRDSSFNSSPASRTGSVSGSRPSSPSPRTPSDASRLPKTDLDWSTLLAANAARRSKVPPRMTALRQESLPVPAHGSQQQPTIPTRNSSLPYPANDSPSTPTASGPTAWTPSQRGQQYFPETKPSLQVPVAGQSKTLSRASSPGTAPLGSARPSRPSFPSRHSATELPAMAKPTQLPSEQLRSNESKRVSFDDPSRTKQEVQVLAKKGLSSCPRSQEMAGFSDWYTLTGAPALDFCPDCIEKAFEGTTFRFHFRKSPARSLSTRVKCALGGDPWIRLAWLLTLQRKRIDLELLRSVAQIDEINDPCPRDQHIARQPYGVRDADGYFVRGFWICKNDVEKVECLLPSLKHMFVPLPSRVSLEERQHCAIRPAGNTRFATYLDALISTDEAAGGSRRRVDPEPFIRLVEKKQKLKECSRDNLMRNGMWHFIPSVESLTVCSDCFETVVEPEIQKRKDVALKFQRTLQPVYNQGPGTSCALYSDRMRRVFKRAVRDNDVQYLARKAKERREAELRLQDKLFEVQWKEKRLSQEGGDWEEQRRLDKDRRRITETWVSEWE